MKRFRKLLIIVICVMGIATILYASGGGHDSGKKPNFPPKLTNYKDGHMTGLVDILVNRIEKEPFNLFATLIFLCAIVHTFLTSKFMSLAHRLKHKYEHNKQMGKGENVYINMGAEVFHFLGEVEAVFGIWAIALAWVIVVFHGWQTSINYLSGLSFTEPMFVVVIMTLAATRPVIKFAELMMWRIANLMGGMLTAWWLTILTIGPLLGSFITEPAAMTISALLLSEKFYKLEPSDGFKYATIGLLFVNISVGGTLTNFAAPPVLMVANEWKEFTMGFMMFNFGWKAVIGILLANGFYYFVFRKEMEDLQRQYAIVRYQRELQSQFISKKDLEANLVKIGTIARRELGFAEAFHKKCEDIKKELQSDLTEKMTSREVDKELIHKAFAQEFEESKWKVMGRLFPGLMPSEERPPYIDPDWDKREERVPYWIMFIHLGFIFWVVYNLHYPPLFVAGFLFFLGFSQVTSHYQNNIDLKPALLVGFFLGGLVIHGGVQAWWIAPVLGKLSEIPLNLVATILTAFNDNAAITYLCTQVPNFSIELRYAVVAGAVTGGGLTVIANAPNPAGISILKKHFFNGVSPMKLALSAIIPTIIMGLCFMLLRF